MAHIAEFMVESQGSVGMNDFIARGPSPISKPPSDVVSVSLFLGFLLLTII